MHTVCMWRTTVNATGQHVNVLCSEFICCQQNILIVPVFIIQCELYHVSLWAHLSRSSRASKLHSNISFSTEQCHLYTAYLLSCCSCKQEVDPISYTVFFLFSPHKVHHLLTRLIELVSHLVAIFKRACKLHVASVHIHTLLVIACDEPCVAWYTCMTIHNVLIVCTKH